MNYLVQTSLEVIRVDYHVEYYDALDSDLNNQSEPMRITDLNSHISDHLKFARQLSKELTEVVSIAPTPSNAYLITWKITTIRPSRTEWVCPDSSVGRCVYNDKTDQIHDHCLVCGQPQERK